MFSQVMLPNVSRSVINSSWISPTLIFSCSRQEIKDPHLLLLPPRCFFIETFSMNILNSAPSFVISVLSHCTVAARINLFSSQIVISFSNNSPYCWISPALIFSCSGQKNKGSSSSPSLFSSKHSGWIFWIPLLPLPFQHYPTAQLLPLPGRSIHALWSA